MECDEYEILRYEPEFKDGILDLQTELWGQDRDLNAKYFEWKYDSNPYAIGVLPIYVALHQGKVVGMRGFLSSGWEPGEHPLLYCLVAADACVHPDHRRRGLFHNMSVRAESDLSSSVYAFILSLSSSSTAALGNKKLGWQQIGAWQAAMHLAPIRQDSSRTVKGPTHLGQRIFNRVARPLTKLLISDQRTAIFQKLDENYRAYKKHYRGHLQVESVASAQAMAQLATRLNRNSQIHHVKNESYFVWRFQNPFCQYRFLYWQNQGLKGYLVLQQWIKRHRNQVNIVDWEVTTSDVLGKLLQAAVQLTEVEKLTFWGVDLSEETERRLGKTGFHLADMTIHANNALLKDTPYRSPILLKTINEGRIKDAWGINMDELSDISNWDFRGINSDYY